MSKFKIQNSVITVLTEGLKIYFKNIGKFTLYMLFPVFGQVIGIALIFGLTGWFNNSIPTLIDKYTVLNNFSAITISLLVIILPGLVLFLKAFWDYLVAYGALNSMTEAIITTGKLYDLRAHTEVITRHSFKFVCLFFLISILSLIAINPLFWVLGLIFFIYFILIFQVFTFEENISIIDCFKRSFFLIKGNFARTFVILTVLGIISHYLLTTGASMLLDIVRLSEVLKGIFENWATSLPIGDINTTLASFRIPQITALEIAKQILASAVLFVVTGLTLPMRSICWTLWYKNLAKIKEEKPSKKGK